MTDITVPKLNNNDVTYVLLEWLVESGQPVAADTAVAVVESTKAAEELLAGAAGVLHRMVEPGTECAVGTIIGKVFASEVDRQSFRAADAGPVPATAAAGCVITGPARALAVELGVDPARLEQLGVAVVRRPDVLRLAGQAASPEPARRLELPRSQLGVAEAVTRSHAEIPAAFTVVRVDAGAALAHARTATRALRALVGLPELVLEALGAVAEGHPVCFAAPDSPGVLRRADGIHVAVTVDVGTGLYLPVVRDCDRRTLGEIATDLMRLRRLAMRAQFRAADLTGGSVVLSLNTDPDVVLTQPIVAPGTVCAVSLGGVHTDAVLDPATGAVRERSTVMLGAAYDHRYVNGGDAVQLLKAVKGRLERPSPDLGTPAGKGPPLA